MIDDFAARIRALDAQIAPLVWRIDLSGPDWRRKVKAQGEKIRTEGYPPDIPILDRANLRAEAEGLLRELLDAYVAAGAEDRARLRALVQENQTFAWAVGGAGPIAIAAGPAMTDSRCRDCLTWFVLEDQGRDPRDAILWLQKLCTRARTSGLPLRTLLEAAAAMASDVARFAKIGGMSTRALLQHQANRLPPNG